MNSKIFEFLKDKDAKVTREQFIKLVTETKDELDSESYSAITSGEPLKVARYVGSLEAFDLVLKLFDRLEDARPPQSKKMIPIYFVTFDIMKNGVLVSKGRAVFPYEITHWSLIPYDFEERLKKAREAKENETIIITSVSIVGETEEEDGSENED